MRILLIAYNDPPQASPQAIRWHYLSRELARRGAKVHVLAPDVPAQAGAALDVPARTETRMSCYGERRFGALSCGTVNNIVADVSEGSGKRIVLMAHMDSVAAGPGAGTRGPAAPASRR